MQTCTRCQTTKRMAHDRHNRKCWKKNNAGNETSSGDTWWVQMVWDSNENKSNEIIWFITITISLLETLLYINLPQGMNACALCARLFSICFSSSIFPFAVWFPDKFACNESIWCVRRFSCEYVCATWYLFAFATESCRLFSGISREKAAKWALHFAHHTRSLWLVLQPRWLFTFFLAPYSIWSTPATHSDMTMPLCFFFALNFFGFFDVERKK